MIFRLKPLLPTVCALLLLATAAVQAQTGPIPSDKLLKLHYVVSGPDEASAVMEARMRAVRTAVGRSFFTDYLLRARNLLTPYLEQNYKPFIAYEKVLVSEVRGGRRHVELDITVNCEKLFADLTEKRFYYRPAPRPTLYLYLGESFNGAEVQDMTGRQRILEALNKHGEFFYLWEQDKARPMRHNDVSVSITEKKEFVMTEISPYRDPMLTSDTFALACREAERNEVEVFLAGTIESKTTVQNKDVYFDKFQYVETRCVLHLVRADNGEILTSVGTTFTAADRNVNTARKKATLAVVDKLLPNLFTYFEKEKPLDPAKRASSKWDRTVLNGSDLRVMTVGLKDDALSIVRQLMTGVGPDVEVLTRATYSNIGVYSVSWPGEKVKDELKDIIFKLRQNAFPGLNIVFVPPYGIILEVI